MYALVCRTFQKKLKGVWVRKVGYAVRAVRAVRHRGTLAPPKKSLTKLLGPAVDPAGTPRDLPAGGGGTLIDRYANNHPAPFLRSLSYPVKKSL